MTFRTLLGEEPGLTEAHPSASVCQLLKTDDDVGLNAMTVFVVRRFPGEREFQAFRWHYDEIAS